MQSKMRGYPTILVLLAGLGGCGVRPTAPITDQQMLKLAEDSARRESSAATVRPAQSSHPNLGTWQMVSPLPEFGFYCARLRETTTAPDRKFIAVSRTGDIIMPVSAGQLATWVAAADRSRWNDDDFMHAATLLVHLQET